MDCSKISQLFIAIDHPRIACEVSVMNSKTIIFVTTALYLHQTDFPPLRQRDLQLRPDCSTSEQAVTDSVYLICSLENVIQQLYLRDYIDTRYIIKVK